MPPRLRVQAGQRWSRHAGLAALPWAQEHPAHRPIHRNGARPVQGLLEGLTWSTRRAGGQGSRPDVAVKRTDPSRRTKTKTVSRLGDKSCDHVPAGLFLVVRSRGLTAVSASI